MCGVSYPSAEMQSVYSTPTLQVNIKLLTHITKIIAIVQQKSTNNVHNYIYIYIYIYIFH